MDTGPECFKSLMIEYAFGRVVVDLLFVISSKMLCKDGDSKQYQAAKNGVIFGHKFVLGVLDCVQRTLSCTQSTH